MEFYTFNKGPIDSKFSISQFCINGLKLDITDRKNEIIEFLMKKPFFKRL